ncbi:hypothetical protein F5Y09DRAFT_154345 [Xylaria sp. FL1042]|nr:hypothetical protein F5Y09DRAFT_154345 [Xylaria sp. FL1042]
MVSLAEDKACKPAQAIVSTRELVSKAASNRSTHDRNLDGRLESHENSAPSTPTSAHTINAFDVDIEAMKPAQSQENLRKGSTNGNRFRSDSSVWPGQAHWREKTLAAKRKNRSCQCLTRLNKRAQIAIKIAIVLLVVGVAVGVGFGISKSLGARIWQPGDDRR